MLTNFKKNKKRNDKKHYAWYILGFLIFVILVFLTIKNIGIWQKKQQLVARISGLEKQIHDMKSNNEKLKELIAGVNDDQYIEKVAREELDLQKPGEQVVSFVIPKDDTQKVDVAKQNFLQKLWSWIAGK